MSAPLDDDRCAGCDEPDARFMGVPGEESDDHVYECQSCRRRWVIHVD